MGFHHRKLMEEPPSACDSSCTYCLSSPACSHGLCFVVCRTLPPSPPDYHNNDNDSPSPSNNNFSPLLTAALAVIGAALIVLCCYAIYSRYFLRRRNSRRRQQPQTEVIHDEFLDEDDGPVVDHPIWYIRTTGLQPSVISSIAVCKYKSAEGIVEGTECSVCLGEFEEDESLRLLPKCNHAFHVPCIDTWLRSHTNCPMCRAPIVKSAAGTPLPEPNVENSGPVGETQVGVSGTSGGSDGEIEDEAFELGIVIEEEGGLPDENGERRGESSSEDVNGIQPIRRSVSMDSLSASKISLAVGNVFPVESGGNSNNQLVKVNEGNRGIVSKRVDRNQNSQRLLGNSSTQSRPHSMKRSSSWNGKFLLCRNSTGVPVLRSF